MRSKTRLYPKKQATLYQADLRAEKIIKEELLFARPGYGGVQKESDEIQGQDPTRRWVVDP